MPDKYPPALEIFKDHDWAVVKKVLSKDALNIIQNYLFMMESFVVDGDPQSPLSYSQYGDRLTDSLLKHCCPLVERKTGLELFPTYSYYRIYLPGSDLIAHTDRIACEYSCSLCIGHHYVTEDRAYQWPLYFAGLGEKRDEVHPVATEPGDMVIYRGFTTPHWRKPLLVEEGSWHLQVFLHYVDQSGPFRICKFDGRPQLGMPESSCDPEILEKMEELRAQYRKKLKEG